MGSFDMACAVSGISLGCGQKVKLLFIIANPWRTGFITSPTNLFTFCSFPIDAIYDDYGTYNIDEEQPNWKEFIRFVGENAKHMVHEGPGYKEFDPSKKNHLGQIYLQESIFLGRVAIQGEKLSPYPIHHHVYESLMSRTETCIGSIDWGELCVEYKNDLFVDRKVVNYVASRIIHSGSGIFYPTYDFGEYCSNNETGVLAMNLAEIAMLNIWFTNIRHMIVPTMSAGQDFRYKESVRFHSVCVGIAKKLQEEFDADQEKED